MQWIPIRDNKVVFLYLVVVRYSNQSDKLKFGYNISLH